MKKGSNIGPDQEEWAYYSAIHFHVGVPPVYTSSINAPAGTRTGLLLELAELLPQAERSHLR